MCAHRLLGRGLFAEIDKEALIAGVNTMLEIATKLLEKKRKMGDRLLSKERPNDDEKNPRWKMCFRLILDSIFVWM
jgi:hypothetical protein